MDASGNTVYSELCRRVAKSEHGFLYAELGRCHSAWNRFAYYYRAAGGLCAVQIQIPHGEILEYPVYGGTVYQCELYCSAYFSYAE